MRRFSENTPKRNICDEAMTFLGDAQFLKLHFVHFNESSLEQCFYNVL